MSRRNEVVYLDGVSREDFYDATEAAEFLEINKERLQRLTQAMWEGFPQIVKITSNRAKTFYKKSEIEAWAEDHDPLQEDRKKLIEMAKEIDPNVFVQRGSRKHEPAPMTPFMVFDHVIRNNRKLRESM